MNIKMKRTQMTEIGYLRRGSSYSIKKSGIQATVAADLIKRDMAVEVTAADLKKDKEAAEKISASKVAPN